MALITFFMPERVGLLEGKGQEGSYLKEIRHTI